MYRIIYTYYAIPYPTKKFVNVKKKKKVVFKSFQIRKYKTEKSQKKIQNLAVNYLTLPRCDTLFNYRL